MKRSLSKNFVIYSILVLVLLFFAFPIIYFVYISFLPAQDIYKIISFNFTLENYVKLFTKGFLEESTYEILYLPLINSLVISLISGLVTLFVSLLAAYSIHGFKYKGRNGISFFILTLYMVPPIVTFVPVWYLAQLLHLLDTHILLIWCYSFFGIPLATWLLRSFLLTIPSEIEEAALVDGCTKVGAFMQVTFPLLKPGIAVALVLTFLVNWNEFLFASTLTSFNAITLPVILGKFGLWLYIDWCSMAAIATIALIPVIILTLICQRYIISGLTLGAVKGV